MMAKPQPVLRHVLINDHQHEIEIAMWRKPISTNCLTRASPTASVEAPTSPRNPFWRRCSTSRAPARVFARERDAAPRRRRHHQRRSRDEFRRQAAKARRPVRVVSNYADAIVTATRDGCALAAEYASIPVINGGDGAHETDADALRPLHAQAQAQLKNLKVAISATAWQPQHPPIRYAACLCDHDLMAAPGMELRRTSIAA